MRRFILAVVFCYQSISFAQTQGEKTFSLTLPSVALLDLESLVNRNLIMSFNPPLEAGSAISPPESNSSLWLNFSSAVTISQTRRVTVQASGVLPAGISISVNAAGPSGSGAGTRGVAVGSLVLSNSTQNIITGIGGAYTGNGAGNGFQLTYQVSAVSNYSALRSDYFTLNVIYTLTDN